jgi:hypothetical protein
MADALYCFMPVSSVLAKRRRKIVSLITTYSGIVFLRSA